jgi:hypothetical protein
MTTVEHKIDTSRAMHASPLRAEDASVALQHYLEAEIQRRNMPDDLAPADFLTILHGHPQVQGEHKVRPYARCEVPWDRDYLDRIAQVAYERYTARRTAQDVPTMIIVPSPLTRRQIDELLGDRLNYVMVFGAESIYFQDTVHALAVDGRDIGVEATCDRYVKRETSNVKRSWGVNVLGAHTDWISSDGEGVERALTVGDTGFVKEVAFQEPVPIHIVQILHLPLKRERQLHRELSIHFRDRGIPQINPYENSSERADDKAWAHALWDQSGRKIASPEYALIPQHSSQEEIAARLRTFLKNTRKPDIVVQPNRGTEGCKVKKFDGISAKRITSSSPIVKYIKDQVLPEDDAIVRERRGNVWYRDQSSDVKRETLNVKRLNVAFRINVAWNGSEFAAESGYAQVAKDAETFPASRGRGGTIVDINEALANLYYHNGGKWIRFIPTDEDIAAMKEAAICAACGLNAGLDVVDYLKLMGIDVLLEVEEQGARNVKRQTSNVKHLDMVPVVLEANPRPAGLSHSSEIIGISDRRPQPRISMEIFRFIESMGL